MMYDFIMILKTIMTVCDLHKIYLFVYDWSLVKKLSLIRKI